MSDGVTRELEGKALPAGGAFLALPLRDDNPSPTDLLGFSDVVAAIEATVTRPDLDPITVGVNAPWGGGKTTVLRLLEKQLGSRQDVLVAYVSPWEYDRNTDTKAALISTVLNCLEQSVKDQGTSATAIREQFSKLRKRVNVTKAVKVAASSALTMSLPSVDSLVAIFGEGDSDPSLQGFREQFALLVAREELADINQVVVLVDDLDRSLPDTVVECLEAIKLFLSVEKMAFVIAADEANVARAIGRRLASTGQPTTAREYLEKIVHIPFRIPALTRERTGEYLALLMLRDIDDVPAVLSKLDSTRGETGSLAKRLGDSAPGASRPDFDLAERLAPILHSHTQGNPRRLKRFLNALWLRYALASSRGVELELPACAKLMVAELLRPDLFAQLLGWYSADTLSDKVAEIEDGEGDHSAQTLEWGRLEPSLKELDLGPYLLLAASLRGDTVEDAALPSHLREAADELTSESKVARRRGAKKIEEIPPAERIVLARYIAAQMRHHRGLERQQALASSVSILASDPAIAKTAAEELALIPASAITTPVPLSLLATNQPVEFVELVRQWSTHPDAPERTRLAAEEALKSLS